MESMNNVDKTLIHISHLHPLQLIASPESKPICHACKMPCAEQSYGCIQCNYFLHITCATIRRSMDHLSHPEHSLKLELTSPYQHGQYGCDGCGVDGSSFCLRCGECGYDLHLHCAAIRHEVNHHSHHHPLILAYKNPYPPNTVAICDLCNKHVDVNKWFYHCTCCNFCGHVGCFSPEKIEVLSSGLQANETLPPPQQMQPQPQPQGAVQGNETTLLQLQEQMLQAQAINISANMAMSTIRKAEEATNIVFNKVHYVERRYT